MTGLHLIAAGHTPALRRAVFGGDPDLDEGGLSAALALRHPLRGTCVTAPSRAARQTAAALFTLPAGPAASPGPGPVAAGHPAALSAGHPAVSSASRPVVVEEPALADPDYGTWTGRTLDQIDPADLHTWLTDPAAHPHGGESLVDVAARTSTWLHQQTGRTLTAIAHPMIIRTLLTAALDLPATHIRRLDVAPLATIRLTHHTHWHLHFRPT